MGRPGVFSRMSLDGHIAGRNGDISRRNVDAPGGLRLRRQAPENLPEGATALGMAIKKTDGERVRRI